MSTWPHLNKAPIVEGLIDIRVESLPASRLQVLRAACDELAVDFPSREEIRTFAGQLSFTPAGPSFSAQTSGPNGMMLRSADQTWVAQFRLDGFTLSRLEPYTSWDDLKGRAKALWDRYKAAAQPQKTVRLACRYINRIQLPPRESFDKTFATTFSIPASLPQGIAGYLLRVVIPFENEHALAIVTQALPENSQDCTFDLDAFAILPDGIGEDDTWTRLEQLRNVKNRLFFESLTPQALESFR